MKAYLVTGNPGSGKSTLAAELSRRGLIAVEADDLAFWADGTGERVNQPFDPDDSWLLAHRWVWSRAALERCIAAAGGSGERMFFCGIARNQTEMLDLFTRVFLLVIDDITQEARLISPAKTTSPARADAIKQQIREGRPIFQAQMLSAGAIPLDGAASPQVVADSLLAHLSPDRNPQT